MAVEVNPEVTLVTPDGNTSNYIPMSLGMAKGDILVCRGDNDFYRLPVGTDGQILVADSTAEFGIKWADPE